MGARKTRLAVRSTTSEHDALHASRLPPLRSMRPRARRASMPSPRSGRYRSLLLSRATPSYVAVIWDMRRSMRR